MARKKESGKGTPNAPAEELKAKDVVKTLPELDKYYKNPIGSGIKKITKK